MATINRSVVWYCNVCNAQNSVEDGECQFCPCGGPDCKRDNCSGPWHPGRAEAATDDGPEPDEEPDRGCGCGHPDCGAC